MKKKEVDIDYLNARIENQLRIHWKWLKNMDYEHLHKFIMNIIDKKEENEKER